MHHHSGRPAVWLTPLLVALVSCSGGTEEVRVGAPESSSALATAATPSAASAAPAGAVAPTADADAPDLVPSSSSEVPSADDLPTRPGAPYEIEPFDNLGGPYDAFLDTIPSRCPEGEGPQCLVIVATIVGDDTVPEECEVTSFDYDPVPGPAEVPEEDRKLQRGTRVDVGVACPEPAVDPQDPSGPTSDPQTEPESGTEPEPEPESESGTEPEPEPEPTAEPDTEPEPAAEPDTQPEPEAEPLPGASEPSAP